MSDLFGHGRPNLSRCGPCRPPSSYNSVCCSATSTVFLLGKATYNISLPSIIGISSGLINSDQYQPCCWWLINSYFRQMSSLQWPVISPATHANQAGACKVPTYGNLVCKGNGISFRGFQLIDKVNMSYPSHSRKNRAVKCTLYSPSNESNSKAEDFMEGDTAYVNAFVVETAEVRGSSDGLMVLMKDGKVLRCVHNNPRSRHQPDYTQNSLILLKIEEDVTGLLLPLLVLEKKPGMQLMDDATDDVQIARPSIYEVVMEMIEKMDYTVKLVRVADGAHGSYVSHMYLTKVNDKAEIISFDLQPSDAINIAIRCKAPIQVDRHLAYNDCLKIIEFAKPAAEGFSADDVLLFSAELDRPSDEQCVDAKEFNLLRNMLVAAVEERYCDAAQWRDKLNQLRSTWLWMFV